MTQVQKIASKHQWIEETLHPSWQQRFNTEHTLCDIQTAYQHLVIFKNDWFGNVMMLDGNIQTTEKDEFIYHEMMTHVPLMAHPNPKSVLVIGGGDGGIIREVLRHPNVEKVVMVEIDEIVVEMSKKYFPNHSQGAFNDPRVTLIIDDAAAFLKKTNDRFDVILTDSTDPTGPGEHLFTEEFYQNCKNHLEKDGILVTQSGVPFMQPTGIYNMQNMLSKFFEAVDFYQATIPTYVGGSMVFGFATNAKTNSFDEIKRRTTTLQNQLHYWTPEIHQAAFLLPPFLQALRTNKKSQIS